MKDSTDRNPVRSSVREFYRYLSYVSVDEGRIEALASELAGEPFVLPDWRMPVFPDEREEGTTPEDVIDYVFVGNSINFAFRDFHTGERFAARLDGQEWVGAFGMWACLKRAYDAGEPILSGDYLRSLTRADVSRIFASSSASGIPMLEKRHEILTSIGRVLESSFDGRFHRFLDGSPPRLFACGEGITERLVREFPSFDDSNEVETGDGTLVIHFFKRAQLAPAMCFGRFQDAPAFGLDDPENFTVFADYNLPNVLRYYGILDYTESLRSLIDEGTLLEEGSREEVELRAATVYAADRLMEAINERRDRPIYGPHLDAKLFMMRDEVETSVHHTRTTSY